MRNISRIPYCKYLFLLVLFTFCNNMKGEQKFHTLNASNGLLDNSAQQIVNLDDGRMIITTLGNINFYDGANFYYIHSRYNNDFYLKDYKGHYHTYIDNKNYLWLKDKHKVYCINLMTEKYESVKKVLSRRLGNKNYTDLFGTEDGCLWLVENSKYLYGIDAKVKIRLPREAGNLQDLDVYERKYLMLFFGNGMLYMYNLKDGRLLKKSCAYSPSDQAYYDASSLVKFHNGKYYQLRNGKKNSVLLVYDVKTNQWKVVLKVPYHFNNMAFKNDSALYIACEYGYYIYNVATQSLTHNNLIYTDDDKIIDTDINTICFDHQGGMWFGTEKRGVLYCKPVETPFTLLGWEDPRSLALLKCIDRNKVQTQFNKRSYHCTVRVGNITWLGTDDGLSMFKGKTHLRTFNTKDGLPNNVVHSIVPDRTGNLWLSTRYGIACVVYNKKFKKYEIHNFTQRDGLGYELYENGKSVLLPDGKIAMQSIDNITVFDPQRVLNNISRIHSLKTKLTPVIVNLFVMGNRVEVGKSYDKNTILSKAISKSDSIELNFNQNNITFIVSAMNYFRPNETYFRYRLLGSDNSSWKVVPTYSFEGRSAKDGEISINYNSLSPGTYRLEMQASMFNDVWDGGTKSIIISVNQPWWRRTGLQLLLLLTLITISCLDFVYYSKVLKLKTQIKHSDSSIMHRLYDYVKNCNKLSGSILSPNPSTSLFGAEDDISRLITNDEVSFIRKIIPVITQHQPGTYTMSQLCTDTGLKREDVYKYSKKILNTQLRIMTMLLRLTNAARLLVETDHTVESISDITRFVNVEYFRTCFKNEYKCTPEEYRQQNQ